MRRKSRKNKWREMQSEFQDMVRKFSYCDDMDFRDPYERYETIDLDLGYV